ncbi:hypothetical protein ACS0PU_012517 [Formica fusca]
MEEFKGKSKNSTVYFYEGYAYNIDKRLRVTYRCSTRRITGCRGLAKVGEDGKVTINPLHNHAPDNARIQKYVLKQEMLHLSRETLQAPKDIFDDVSRRNPESAAFIAFKSIRSQLNRERKKSRPKLPQSIAMLADELNNYIPITHIYKGSLTANDGKKALLFSNDKLLQALESSTEIFCDGTFSVVPRVPSLSQLYTIHIRYMDKVLAVIFVLCEARTTALYEKIWSKVIEFVPNLLMNIKFIMTDYECAAMSAMEKYFPNATIHGCWFHLNQALQRKWNHLGLRNSSNIILSMAMTIPLLPEQYFTQAYCILWNTCEEKNPEYEKLKEFLNYFEKTWLSKASKVSVYKCPVRTNNAVESFHNVINRKLGDHHPNVWIFLEKLKNVIMDQTIDLERLKNNKEVRSVRSRKSLERDKKILQAQADLVSGRLPLQHFLRIFINKLDYYSYNESLTVRASENGSVMNETDFTQCNSALSENILYESAMNETESTQCNFALPENILYESAMNEMEFIQCNSAASENILNGSVMNETDSTQCNSAPSENILYESAMNETGSTRCNSAGSENILNESAMNETEFTQCNSAPPENILYESAMNKMEFIQCNSAASENILNGSVMNETDSTQCNSAPSENILYESAMNETESTRCNSATSENILYESAMNETDSTQCENMATEKICFITEILEPKIKLHRLSEKDIIKERNRQVLKSIENFDIKSTEQQSKRNYFSVRRTIDKRVKLRIKKTSRKLQRNVKKTSEDKH